MPSPGRSDRVKKVPDTGFLAGWVYAKLDMDTKDTFPALFYIKAARLLFLGEPTDEEN